MEHGISKNQIISELTRSPHGKLSEYVPVGKQAAQQEPEFLAHLVAWNHIKGQVRDSQVALPLIAMAVAGYPFVDNSLAHLALLGPRELLRAVRFAKEIRVPGHMSMLRRMVADYLKERERPWAKWERVAIQHRNTLKELYCLLHLDMPDKVRNVLFNHMYPAGSIFATVAQLSKMSSVEAAGAIITEKIPFLIAMGALGAKAKDSDLVLALINQMSPTELITNTKMLEKLGVKTNPALRGAFEAALEKASKSKKNVLKTTRAAEAIEDEGLRTKLQAVQDRQIQSMGPEGNWLVLADKSGSMTSAIETARHVSAALAKMVKGNVTLTFFDVAPMTIDVTGSSLDIIKKGTQHISANGGTSIGCGLQRLLDSKTAVDGIVIVSDGEENTAPRFCDVYQRYSKMVDKEVPVYLYLIGSTRNNLCLSAQSVGIDIQVFDVSRNVDYYSLPNTVATLRSNRYSLIDEVMSTPLLSLKEVLKNSKEELVSA